MNREDRAHLRDRLDQPRCGIARPDGLDQTRDDVPPDPRIDPPGNARIDEDLGIVLGLGHIDQHAGPMPGAGQTMPEEFADRRLVGAGALYSRRDQRPAQMRGSRMRGSTRAPATACDQKDRGGAELA